MTEFSPAVNGRQPWPGLESWTEGDSQQFSGRDHEIDELLRLVKREVLTIVFGPSGTGKTSLLQAGLFPRLRGSSYLPVLIRLDHSGEHPGYVHQARMLLEQAIQAHNLEAEARLSLPGFISQRESLWEYLHSIVLWDSRNQPVTPVLVFDQFEEIFTLAKDGDASRSFLTELADLVENYIPARIRAQMEEHSATIPPSIDQQPCRFILSLREDFLWHLDALRKAMPSVMHNRFLVSRMNTDQALLAVTGPGAGIVEEVVARHIVSFVAAEGAHASQKALIDPSLLSVVCRELNSRRIELGKGTITDDLLQQSRAGILNDFYERSFAGLNRAARAFVEDRLLTQSGFRGTVPVEEAMNAGLTEEDIRTLENRRLIRVEERLGIPHLELTHDVLTEVVRKSRAQRQQRELEERIREAARLRRRRQSTTVAVLTLVLAGILGAVLFYRSQWKGAASEVDYRAAFAEMKQDDTSTSLAYLADAMRNNSGNEKAVALTLDEMRDFLLPAMVLQHSEEVWGRLLSPDGSLVLTASADGTAQVWDAKTGRPVAGPMRHCAVNESCLVKSAEFNSDGTKVVTASYDGTARLWDARSGKPLLESPLRPVNGGKVYAAKFSPDSGRIVTAADNGTVQIWDSRTGKPIGDTMQHDKTVWSAVFNASGTLVLSASADHTARVWDAWTGKPILSAAGEAVVLRHKDEVNIAVFSPDDKWIVTASDDGTAQIWDGHTFKAAGQPMQHKAQVNFAGFSPDSRFVATASSDHTARIWDVTTGEGIGDPMRHDNWVRSANFSPDGRMLVSTSYDRTARVWDARTGLAIGEPLRHSASVSMARFSKDNSFIVTASFNHTAQIWKWQPIRRFPAIQQPGPTISAFFAGDDEHIAVVSTQGVGTWNAKTGQAATVAKDPQENGGDDITAAHISSNGKWLLTMTKGAAQVWSTTNGVSAAVIPISDLADGAVSADGREIVTASAHEVRLWDTRSHKSVWSRSIHSDGTVSGVGFSPDGHMIVTYTYQGTVNLWNTIDAKPIGKTMRHDARVYSAGFSGDSRWLVTASADHYASVWDARTGDAAGAKMKHGSWVLDARFSGDGKWIVTASADESAKIWDARTHRQAGAALAQKDAVSSACFSPDGRWVLTLSRDGIAQVWDARTGFAMGKAIGEETKIVSVNFSPDGKWLVTAAADRTARIREAPVATTRAASWLVETAEALGGYSLNAQGLLDFTAPDPAGLRERLSHLTGTDEITRFGRWLAADPATRPVSPGDDLLVN